MLGDWVLRYDGTEYAFGAEGRDVELMGWTFAADSYRVDDAAQPRRDGIAFGRDFVEAGELRIELIIDLTSGREPVDVRARQAWAIRQALAAAWRADALRDQPRALAELVMGGQQMLLGRPRRVTFDDTHQGRGLIKASAAFLPVSTAVYAVDETGHAPWFEQTVGLVPAQIGGLVAPLVAPLSTAESSTRARPFTVGGSAPVWPIIIVTGPLQSGAQVELTRGWMLRLNRALAFDDVVTVDTRPEQSNMTFNGRPTNVLDPASTRLALASIAPGLQEIALRGASVEGTATVTIRWREQEAG